MIARLPGPEFAHFSTGHCPSVNLETRLGAMVNLSAEVPFCGFRSVIGTLWAMEDCPIIEPLQCSAAAKLLIGRTFESCFRSSDYIFQRC
jgi:hypothetical protein